MKRKLAGCGHYEQIKFRGKWKCVACGKILTIEESMQNSIELSDVITSAIVTGRPLSESLDDMRGSKEWNAMLAGIQSKGVMRKRRRVIASSKK